MKFSSLNECAALITDKDIVEAMKKIPGYLDITPSDFMEIYGVAFDHALARLKDAIKAEEVMTQNVIFVYDHTPLPEVIKTMADHDNTRLLGIIARSDLVKTMR